MAEIDELRDRIAELERQNTALHASTSHPSGGRARAIGAAVLIIVGLVLAPVAVVGTWARGQLVDTEKFVQTYAPLAEDPAVQAYVADEVTKAIEDRVDIKATVNDVFDGVRQLGLPDRANTALGLLEAPAVQGVQTLLSNAVTRVVSSPAFADLWAQTLRATHSRAIAAIQGDANSALVISGNGTLSIRLDVVSDAVKTQLTSQGFALANAIPSIDREVTIAQADALASARTYYPIVVALGYWLPWIALAFLAGGIAVARRRVATFTRTALALGILFLVVAGAFGVGRFIAVSALSPSVLSTGAAEALYTQVTEPLVATSIALAVFGGFAAIGGWLAGSSHTATRIRQGGEHAFSSLRAAGDRHGVGTGGFGRAVDRLSPALRVLIVVGGVLVLFLNRPASVSGVIWTVVGVVVLLLVVEVLRRPAEASNPAAPQEAATEHGAGSGSGSGADSGPGAGSGSGSGSGEPGS